MKFRHIFKSAALLLLLLATLVAAQESATDEYPQDPYLQFRPPFARSLPVQILLTGVVLTLTVVLLIHLLFTAQYHWPLAPVNYVLQVSGVTTLLISLIATIHVILSTSGSESEGWPYMLSYLAVNVPPSDLGDDSEDWSVAERATWLVMMASTSGLIQITHIQFLTLLYPSRLEKQLIFALLGPMAIVAAVMQLLPINSNPNVIYVSTAVKNVCNATLSLLFTVALLIWGFLVNRQQAWRTDGGTAVFGCAALILALVSTALNLIYVHKEDEYVWLPGLMWAVILWQSFLGWWWWVGAGSGSGLGDKEDMEEKLRKEAKRENRRREAKERRQETKKRAKKVWRDVTGAFGREQEDAGIAGQSSSTESRPRPPSRLSNLRARSPAEGVSSTTSAHPPDSESPPDSPARSVVSSSISSLSGTSLRTLPRFIPIAIQRFYASVRRAHLIAAQKQAVERVERIREMERNGVSDSSRPTWGVSNLLWRTRTRREPSARRDPDVDVEGDKGEGEYEMHERNEWRHNRSREGGRQEDHENSEDEIEDAESGRGYPRGRRQEQDQVRNRDKGEEESSVNATSTRSSSTQPNERPRSLWWWGPLGRWRLQDSTTYS
ncbi:hypothetical protein P691DRAFT_808327 [Macrolepiota fuliginosa MF-IS2]|uniref:Uncharacterized protein n=1 Tax=Macrolepiota fuliginosa MF-IS2 TaxID=1400762 RepID=A0A9P5X2V0_9AGAR|nr:hypothetical protein P691DRAFT_808327 [Macrolepiota fuliginosa MF-IS2]